MKPFISILLLVTFFGSKIVSGHPLTDSSLDSTTTVPSGVSLENKIKSATERIKVLSQKVEDSLAQSIVADASPVTEAVPDVDTVLSYAAEPEISLPANVPAPKPDTVRDQKFSTILKELDELEVVLQDGIRDFTQTRQHAFRSMLRPMLQQVQQLKSNLTQLRNRLISYVALTELRQQVTDIRNEVGDAITSNRPPAASPLANSLSEETTEDLKSLQDALSWVSE